MTKRQMAKKEVLKTKMKIRITWLSSRSKKKRKKHFVSKLKKSVKSKSKRKLNVEPNLLRRNVLGLRLKLQRRKLAAKLQKKRSSPILTKS